MFRLLVAVIPALGLASVASAATAPAPTAPTAKVVLTPSQTKLLWATVNICDTPAHPDTVGVAGSMPVVKKANRLYMRFRVQYFDEGSNTFKPVPGVDADSDWEIVDPGTGKTRTAGHDFELAKPKDADGYTVRAEISYEWRKGKKVILGAKRLTTAKHPKTAAADPKKFSAASCTIKP